MTTVMKLKMLDGAPNEIVMERDFDAPRALVHRAMTEPELVKRWQGNSRSELTTVDIDARPGGTYRYVYTAHGGSFAFSFTGTYREVSEARTVLTQRFNDMPDEAVVTTTLTEKSGKTTMRVVMAFSSAEIRNTVVKTGMADGAGESYDNLETLLAG
jgi:uncharacterized protein YndB with AHSA1/START domain